MNWKLAMKSKWHEIPKALFTRKPTVTTTNQKAFEDIVKEIKPGARIPMRDNHYPTYAGWASSSTGFGGLSDSPLGPMTHAGTAGYPTTYQHTPYQTQATLQKHYCAVYGLMFVSGLYIGGA
jgi:hypothetical protein